MKPAAVNDHVSYMRGISRNVEGRLLTDFEPVDAFVTAVNKDGTVNLRYVHPADAAYHHHRTVDDSTIWATADSCVEGAGQWQWQRALPADAAAVTRPPLVPTVRSGSARLE